MNSQTADASVLSKCHLRCRLTKLVLQECNSLISLSNSVLSPWTTAFSTSATRRINSARSRAVCRTWYLRIANGISTIGRLFVPQALGTCIEDKRVLVSCSDERKILLKLAGL